MFIAKSYEKLSEKVRAPPIVGASGDASPRTPVLHYSRISAHSLCSSGGSVRARQRSVPRPNYNAPVQTNSSLYPMIGITGLLHLVAVVDKLRTSQRIEEKGTLCRPASSPPAVKQQPCPSLVGAVACPQSPAPCVAPQSTAGTPTRQGGHEKGGPSCLAIT
jgi:hypothetical protein